MRNWLKFGIFSILVILGGFGSCALFEVWLDQATSSVPGSQFNYKEQLERDKASDERQELKKIEAAELAREMAQERRLEEKLAGADEITRKIEMLKVEYEAALLVNVPSSNKIRHAILELAENGSASDRLFSELEQIDKRADEIRAKVRQQRDIEFEERQARWRRGESLKSPWSKSADFQDLFSRLTAAATEDQLVEAASLFKESKLSEQDLLGLCAYYDSTADLKMKYVLVDILLYNARSSGARSKLLQILAAPGEWPIKSWISHTLANDEKLQLAAEEVQQLVTLYHSESHALVRDNIANLIGRHGHVDHADLLFQIAQQDASEEIRATAIAYLDCARLTHRQFLLEVVRSDTHTFDARIHAWRSLWPTLFTDVSGKSEEETVAGLRNAPPPDAEVVAVLKNVLQGSAKGTEKEKEPGGLEDGNEEDWIEPAVREWLLREYLLDWVVYRPSDDVFDEVLKRIASNDGDEVIRSRARTLLRLFDRPRESESK